jgi:hypothetical protein
MPFQKGRVKAGGRKPGVKNKVTFAREKALSDLVVDSKDSVSFFLSVMRNDIAPFDKREAAADRLLPYFNPKLASIEARAGGATHEDRWKSCASCLMRMTDHAPALQAHRQAPLFSRSAGTRQEPTAGGLRNSRSRAARSTTRLVAPWQRSDAARCRGRRPRSVASWSSACQVAFQNICAHLVADLVHQRCPDRIVYSVGIIDGVRQKRRRQIGDCYASGMLMNALNNRPRRRSGAPAHV